MAVAGPSADFAIEVKADSLLNQLSDEISNLVLKVASEATSNQTPSGVRLVTEGDIINAAQYLCTVLHELEQRDDLSPEHKTAFAMLREKVQSLSPSVDAADAER